MIRSRLVPFAHAIAAAAVVMLRGLAAALGVLAAGFWAHTPPVAWRENGCVANSRSARAPCPAGQCAGHGAACGSCLVFVTSSEQTGGLGGLAGADATCQRLAHAAALPGTYRAWLSTGSASPATRFTRATAPYALPDGTVIALNWADLTSGSLRHAMDQTETGAGINLGDTAWSNSLPDGTPAGSVPKAHCQDWTAAGGNDDGHVGIPFSTYEDWTYTGSRMYCVFPQRLYCFQQP